MRLLQCCLAGRNVRNLFARDRGQSGAHDCRGFCALGVARAQADAPQYIMRARFGEAAWAQFARGPGAFFRWENFARLPRKAEFSHSCCQKSWSKWHTRRPRRFCSRGSSEARMAENAVSSPKRRAFEAIMNYLAQFYSTRSTVNGVSVHCKKTEGGCQKKTASSLMYVSDAS